MIATCNYILPSVIISLQVYLFANIYSAFESNDKPYWYQMLETLVNSIDSIKSKQHNLPKDKDCVQSCPPLD